jgi:hypothetical protein
MFAVSNSKHMKTKFTTSRIINLAIGAAIALSIGFVVFIFLSTTVGPFNDGSTSSATIDELPPIDPVIPDTIPHRRYKQLTDSIRFIRNRKNGMLQGFSLGGVIGFQTMERCEDCNFRAWDKGHIKDIDYLISFGDWKLDTTGGEFFIPLIYFVKEGKSYLRKTICKKKSQSKWGSNFTCIEKDFAIPFRIDTQRKNIMVPVSETTFKIARIIVIGTTILVFIYFVYFVIGGFIKVLAEIAQGTPFSERNVKRLRFIALNLLFIPLGVFLISVLLVPLVFHSYFTSDIRLDAESWKSLGKPAILCLIFAALYRAFKKGKQLKEENDLTV